MVKTVQGKGFRIELEEEVIVRIVAVDDELLVLVLQGPILKEREIDQCAVE